MSDTVISLPAFSINGESLSGSLPLSGMQRLCCQLPIVPSGSLDYRLNGDKDTSGYLFLSVQLSARLPLRCNRCLEVFEFPLATRQRFWLRGGTLPPAGGDEVGEELENGDMPLTEFLTDELLLSLPAVPAHELSACRRAAYLSGLS